MPGRGGGVGGAFMNVFEICLLASLLVEKSMGQDSFSHKELTCLISVDSEQLAKSQCNLYICFPCMEPFT